MAINGTQQVPLDADGCASMKPLRWLLNLSAGAEKPKGRQDSWALAGDASLDSREYVEFVVVDGAGLYIEDRKWPERWGELSPQRTRYARVVEADHGNHRLSIYERFDGMWLEVEGPLILESIAEATVVARKIMAPY